MLKHISSLQNPLVKDVLELQQKSRVRKAKQQFVVEGLNEIRLCQSSGYVIRHLFFDPDSVTEAELEAETGCDPRLNGFCTVNTQVFRKIAYREDVRNAVAVAENKKDERSSWNPGKRSVILVAEGIEKPGNLGALMRTADACGAGAVILADSKIDLFNPNVIRSSVGCVFTVPVMMMSSTEAQIYLKKEGFSVYTSFMAQAENSWDLEYPDRTAIVVGTESTGLTDAWRNPEYRNINIPMFGRVDSLNVSVAVSLLLYEVIRQFNKGKAAGK